jgi:hypothetical protein
MLQMDYPLFFLALSMQLSLLKKKTVSGVVSDAAGPLPGVNVFW